MVKQRNNLRQNCGDADRGWASAQDTNCLSKVPSGMAGMSARSAIGIMHLKVRVIGGRSAKVSELLNDQVWGAKMTASLAPSIRQLQSGVALRGG